MVREGGGLFGTWEAWEKQRSNAKLLPLLLMAETLHQLIGSLSMFIPFFIGFIYLRWCRISSINSINVLLTIYHWCIYLCDILKLPHHRADVLPDTLTVSGWFAGAGSRTGFSWTSSDGFWAEAEGEIHGMTVRWHWLKHSSAARRTTTTASRGSDCDQRHTDCAGRKPCRMATIRGLQNHIRSFRTSFWHASIVHPFFKLLVVVVSSKIRESFSHDSRYFQDFPGISISVRYLFEGNTSILPQHHDPMTPHDPAEVRTWLHGLGLEEAPERAMAPSGGAQLLQVWMMLTLAAFSSWHLSRWLGKNDFGTIIPVFFLLVHIF